MANQLLDASFVQDECLTAPLPQDWQHLPEEALGKRRWLWLGLTLFTVVILLGLILLSDGELALYALLGLVLLFGFLLQLWLPFQLTRTRFLLRRQDFLLESGVWWRQAVLIPYPHADSYTIAFLTGVPGGDFTLSSITNGNARGDMKPLSWLLAPWPPAPCGARATKSSAPAFST